MPNVADPATKSSDAFSVDTQDPFPYTHASWYHFTHPESAHITIAPDICSKVELLWIRIN